LSLSTIKATLHSGFFIARYFCGYKKPPLGGFLLVPWKWWGCTKWDSHVFQNLINNLWVFRTPTTHKTTHKNFKVSFDALLQMLGVV
jgi:hypothetical protein